MKKFFMIAVLAVAALTANAQAKFAWNLGATIGADFLGSGSVSEGSMTYDATVYWVSENLNVGLGAKWENGLYLGGGIAPGVMEQIADRTFSSSNVSLSGIETAYAYYMPFYAQLSYVKAKKMYFDLKVGGELCAGNASSEVGFFMNATPLGYSFNDHNSLGLGYRLQSIFSTTVHGVSINYVHTF